MTPTPRVPHDLTLAPVAVDIDENLQLLRDKTPSELEYELELELDRPEMKRTREERSERILRASLRNVNLHGWDAEVTDDGDRIHLSGGSVTLDIGLSSTIMHYIEGGETV